MPERFYHKCLECGQAALEFKRENNFGPPEVNVGSEPEVGVLNSISIWFECNDGHVSKYTYVLKDSN